MNSKKKIMTLLLAVVFLCSACKACKVRDESQIGTPAFPLKVGFMPAPEKNVTEENAAIVCNELAKATGLKVEPVIAKTNMALIDALGSKKIDVAFINSLGFILAHDWSEANAVLQLKGEDGRTVYSSAIIAGVNAGIKTVDDVNGRSFIYSDPFSLSGYLLPLSVFNEKKITPSKTSFADGYSNVVEAVYNGTADAGAIYYAERDPDGRIHDARVKLVNKYPDMLDKVLVVYKSEPVPTTPIVFRKGLTPALSSQLMKAFEGFNTDPLAIGALNKLYGATGIVPADTKTYLSILDLLKKLGKDVTEVVPGAIEFYKKHLWDVVPSY